MKKFLQFGLCAVISAAVAFFVAVTTVDFSQGELSKLSGEDTVVAEDGSIPSVAERLTPSVVGISSSVNNKSLYSPKETWSMGSGVVVSEDGYILTNHHVIENAQKIYVTLSSGKAISSKAVWSDSNLDLAVLKVDEDKLTPATLGDANETVVGDAVVAIGNPLSMQFQRTVTAGIISAQNRTIALEDDGNTVYMENLIQTDASINPGNSGGPLINMKGEVIGINTIKVTTAEGMGFAIPINICRPLVDRIKKEGSFETPYLGLYAYDKATALYLEGDFSGESGIYVSEVDRDGPAYIAGIRIGDIITGIDSKEVSTMSQLRESIFYHKPGEKVKVDINRNGTRFTATATLKSK